MHIHKSATDSVFVVFDLDGFFDDLRKHYALYLYDFTINFRRQAEVANFKHDATTYSESVNIY